MIASQHPDTMQVSSIGPEFGTSADGFPVALIGDTLLASGGITSTVMMVAPKTRPPSPSSEHPWPELASALSVTQGNAAG